MVSLQERVKELREQIGFLGQTELFEELDEWEQKYIVKSGEIPWWEIEDLKEREKVRKRQWLRMWLTRHLEYPAEARRLFKGRHPGYYAEIMKQFNEEHPGRHAEVMRRYRERHPESASRAGRKYRLTHVGNQHLVAPYKRGTASTVCELCGSLLMNHGKGYHHWTDLNPSAGLWVCSWPCDKFAHAVDRANGNSWQLATAYFDLKKQLTEAYANGEIVRLMKLAGRRRRVSTVINGVNKKYSALGKRDKPEDRHCEVCHIRECREYHHWDDTILGKGVWVCNYCHGFAGTLDACGMSVIDKYLALKARDELRVFSLMRADSVDILQSMFSSLDVTGTKYYQNNVT